MCILTVINYRSNTSVFYMSIPTVSSYKSCYLSMLSVCTISIANSIKEYISIYMCIYDRQVNDHVNVVIGRPIDVCAYTFHHLTRENPSN
ncbi:hypothetical protein L218DRAFT_678629 [Marasmius fiardii PR-910]|nr:hypothetical protein L218DRAFT_678629 [Marasmius fiardii PR-910]